MIRINLLAERRDRRPGPGPAVTVTPGEGFKPIYLVYILFMVAAAAVVGFRYWQLTSTIAAKERTKKEKEEERDRLAEILRKVEEFKQQKARLEKQISVIEELKKKQRAPVILLDQLSRNLPENVWFELVSESNSQVFIDGYAISANKVADFMDNLVSSGYFSKVEPPTYTKAGGTLRFKLQATFQLPEGST